MIFYIASFVTEDITFTAYADTPQLARNLLMHEWEKYAEENTSTFTWRHIAPWVDVYPMEMNTAHRQ